MVLISCSAFFGHFDSRQWYLGFHWVEFNNQYACEMAIDNCCFNSFGFQSKIASYECSLI